MAWRLVEACLGVVTKCRGWMNPQTYDSKKLSGMLLGFVVNVTMAEIVAYRILKRDVVGGELPGHVPELVIISVSCLEALAAPLVSWLGSQRRRQTLGLWMLGPLVCVGSWFALPDPNEREESEFCDAANQTNDTLFTGMTRESTIRLAVVVLSGCVFALSRAAVWARGIALCDEYATDMINVHYGILLSVRAIALILGHRIFTSHADTNFLVQVTILVGFLTLAVVQMFFVMPKGNDDPPAERKKGFLSSVGRVCSNGLAMSQMVALGLIATALWGYGYHENDIIKAKFLLDQATLETDNLVTIVQYFFVLSVLKSTASRFSAPVMKEYCRRAAIRHVVLMSVLVTALFAALALPSCDTGAVAGLGAEYYGHPECSFQCGCQPRWREFSPVCSTDDMTTYLSPCQAGCGAVETVNGINVYTNCTCGGGARVLAGGCAAGACRFALDLHNTIFLILVTVSLLAVQAQGVLVIKSVGRGDRGVALGVTLAVVAALAFVAGPLLYHAIDVANCRWFEGDKCHLLSERFPKVVGFTSAFIALLATLLSVVTSLCVRMAERSEENKQNAETNEDIELP